MERCGNRIQIGIMVAFGDQEHPGGRGRPQRTGLEEPSVRGYALAELTNAPAEPTHTAELVRS
jgi:hypothetical protein